MSNGDYADFKRATTPRASDYADRFHQFADTEIAFVPEANAYRVTEDGSTYGFGNPNFDFRQFRSNLVARWEYKPGSSLYVVWSQDRTDQAVFGRSLTSSLDALRAGSGDQRVPREDELLVRNVESPSRRRDRNGRWRRLAATSISSHRAPGRPDPRMPASSRQ